MKKNKIKNKIKKNIVVFALLAAVGISTTSCSSGQAGINYGDIVVKAEAEGRVDSLAMPDDWANWDETWKDISIFYGIKHSDTDMNSADELAKFDEGIGDIGDVGYAYAKDAKKKNLTLPYITSYWDEIPQWAKDEDGHWIVTYTGTMSFLVNETVESDSLSWEDLRDGNYTVGTSNVRTSSQAQYAVYAAALALGGSPDNIQPGIDLFKKLAIEGRLTDLLDDEEASLSSDVDVNIKWDFNALGYRDTALKSGKHYKAFIPSDGSVTVGYASVINKKAEHPYAAMLAREFILSDAGQYNLAAGYATPIRAVVLPQDLEAKRIPRSQYNDSMIQEGLQYNDSIAAKIVEGWVKEVLPILDAEGRAR